MSSETKTKTKRAGRFYSIEVWQRDGRDEFRVKLGNKIISRHATAEEADAAFAAARNPEVSQ